MSRNDSFSPLQNTFYSTAVAEPSSGIDCSFSPAHRNFPQPMILHLLSTEQKEETGEKRKKKQQKQKQKKHGAQLGHKTGNDADDQVIRSGKTGLKSSRLVEGSRRWRSICNLEVEKGIIGRKRRKNIQKVISKSDSNIYKDLEQVPLTVAA